MAAAVGVRRAAPADLDRIAPMFDAYRGFYGQRSDPALARSFIAARLTGDDAILLLAERDGATAGFAQLYPSFSSVRARRIFILNDLFVAEAQRRQGVARALLAAAAETARTEGAVRLTLSTAVNNDAAQSAYRAAGWSRDEAFQVFNLIVD